MQNKVLQEKRGALLGLTMSTFVMQLMNILVNNVDQLMISRYSQDAVAAVGNANQISWLLMLFFTVLSTASVILVTQYKGAKNTEREHEIYVISLAFNVVLGLVIGVICIAFGRQIFALMNVDSPQIAEFAYQYLAITGGASIIQALIMSYSAIFRANAMAKQTMLISILINILNVFGNWLLIYGQGPFPELGVRGVAISTVVSRLIGLIITVIVFRRRIGRLRWRLLWPFPWRQFGKLIGIGVPAAGENLSYDLAQLAIMGFINTMGLVAVNTKIYAVIITQCAYVFANSLADATQVYLGYLLGAGRHDDADKRLMKTLVTGVVSTVALTAVIYCFSDVIFGIFVANDAENMALRSDILVLAKRIMLIEIVLEIGRAMNLVMVRGLQTAGDIKFPVFMCMVCSWTLSVLGGYIMGIALGWGLVGIWIGMAIDECVRGTILVIRWRAGGWRRLNIVEEKIKGRRREQTA